MCELNEFILQEEGRLKNAGFEAKDIWNNAVVVGIHPEKASLALIEFVYTNPQVDLSLYRGQDQPINRYWLYPIGPKAVDLGINKFFKFMFALGITIE